MIKQKWKWFVHLNYLLIIIKFYLYCIEKNSAQSTSQEKITNILEKYACIYTDMKERKKERKKEERKKERKKKERKRKERKKKKGHIFYSILVNKNENLSQTFGSQCVSCIPKEMVWRLFQQWTKAKHNTIIRRKQ